MPNPYGSPGLSGTNAFGSNYKQFYYTKTREEYQYSYEDWFTIYIFGFVPADRRRKVHKHVTVYVDTYSKSGKLIKSDKLYDYTLHDIEIRSVTNDTVRKEAFGSEYGTNGWWEFVNSFNDAFGDTAITIGVSYSDGKWDIYSYIHDKRKRIEEIRAEEAERQQKYDDRKIKQSIIDALEQYQASQITMTSSGLADFLRSPNLAGNTDNIVDVLKSGLDDYERITTTVQLSSHDVLSYHGSVNVDLVSIYNSVNDNKTYTLLPIHALEYSISVGDTYSAEWLMSASQDAINLPAGNYEVVSVKVINVSDRDQLGNQYVDPLNLTVSWPAADVIIYVHSK